MALHSLRAPGAHVRTGTLSRLVAYLVMLLAGLLAMVLAGCNSGTGGDVTTTSAGGGTVTTTSDAVLFPTADQSGKWGFADRTGAWVIEPQWDFTDSFSDGIARVATGQVKDATWGYIDMTGKAVTPVQYKGANSFSDGLALVRSAADGKWGYIDTTGKLVIPEKFALARDFSEGLAVVAEATDGKCGYIDKTGAYVIEPRFAGAGTFAEGLAAVSAERDGTWGFIDATGKYVIEATFVAVADFSEGFAVAGQAVPGKDPSKAGGITYGLIDTAGAWAVQPTYGMVGSVSEGLARVSITKDDGTVTGGYIDTTGKVVLTSTEWQPAGDFSEGLASVMVGNRFGFIDATGAYVLPPLYDNAEPFTGGLARVIAAGSEPAEIGYVDKTGTIVIWNNPAKNPKWASDTTTTTAK